MHGFFGGVKYLLLINLFVLSYLSVQIANANVSLNINPTLQIDGFISKVTISSDNRFLLIATYSRAIFKPHTVSVWSFKTGKELWRKECSHNKQVFFSSDGKRVYVLNFDTVLLLDTESGHLVKAYKRELSKIESRGKSDDSLWDLRHINFVSISPNDSLLFTASESKAEIWDIKKGAVRFSIQGKNFDRYSGDIAKFSPDGKLLAIRDNKKIKVFDTKHGKLLWRHIGKSRAWDFIDDKTLVFNGYRSLELFNAEDGRSISSKEIPENLTSLNYYSKTDLLLATSYDQTYLFKAKDQQLLKTFPLGKKDNDCFTRSLGGTFSPNGQFLAIVNNKKELWLYDNEGNSLPKLVEKNICIDDINFSSNSDLLVSAEDGTVKFWETSTGKLVKKETDVHNIPRNNKSPRLATTLGHSAKINSVDISLDGNLLISGGNDNNQVHLWHLSSGRELCRAGVNKKSKVNAVRFAPSGKIMVVANDRFVSVYNTSDCSFEKQLPMGGISFIEFSLDGSFMLVDSTVIETNNWQTLSSFNVSNKLFNIPFEDWLYGKYGAGIFVNGNKEILLARRNKINRISLKTSSNIWTASIPEKFKTDYGLESHNNIVNIKLDRQRGIIAAIASDGYLYQFSLHDGKQVNKVLTGKYGQKGIEFLANGKIVTGNMRLDSSPGLDVLQVWDSDSISSVQTLTWEKDESSISSIIALFSRNKKLYAIQDNGRVTVVDSAGKLRKVKSYSLAGKSGPVHSVAFSPDGKKILLGLTSTAVLGVAAIMDLQTGRESKILGTTIKDYDQAMGPSADAPEAILHTRALFVDNESVVTANVRSFQIVNYQNMNQNILEQRSSMIVAPPVVSVSQDKVLFFTLGARIEKYDLANENGVEKLEWDFEGSWMMGNSGVKDIIFSKRGDVAISISDSTKRFALWNVKESKLIKQFGQEESIPTSLLFSDDEKSVYAAHADKSIIQWDIETGENIQSFPGSFEIITSMHRFGSDKIITGSKDGSIRVWDVNNGIELSRYHAESGGVNDIAISDDHKFILGAYDDGSVVIWRTGSESWLAKYISFTNGQWVVVSPDGRYDSNNPGDLPNLSWVMSDDPLMPLPVEIFMKEYYEPRLLPRILAGEKFSPLKSLSKINRVQPKVKIAAIKLEGLANRVSVTVEVAGNNKTYQKNGTEISKSTGVYDLRLFRDGQLVEYAPKRGGSIKLDSKTRKSTITFLNVKLPTNKEGKVEFSAYAFNVDGIKSPTAKMDYQIPFGVPRRVSRAYVVSVGVNTYQNSSWNLQYAANDAAALQKVLADTLKESGLYADADIISIPLISQKGNERAASKARIKAVLDLLAGKPVSPALMAMIPNADKIKPANPEDFLLISYSGHGFADEKGEFYLFPHDTGSGKKRSVAPAVLKNLISSEELSLWLRDVDAGEMTMIVDACNSAASVEGAGFKPGPMGSRGLGQLAYDKGMRILTASQAESVALESSLIRHGVLTYSLIQEGISQQLADYLPQDKKIMMSEWLQYGVKRVPKLNQEIETGAISTASRGFAPTAGVKKDKLSAYAQQPSLFDFNKRSTDAMLMEVK